MSNHEPSFDIWLNSIFGQEVKEWSSDLADEVIIPKSPILQIEYLTQLFAHSQELLKPYCADRIGQGLNYLIADDKMIYAVFDDSIYWQKRQQCIQAIFSLFQNLFAKKCEPTHKEYAASKNLDHICYMWWDVFPSWGTGNADFDRTCLTVMEKILYLNSWVCCESALHGLNHWYYNNREAVIEIIDRFLQTRQKIPESVRQQAIWAKNGLMQ
ncbi:hypothetical protein ACE1CI_28925 [Aerosakkonemataceae cyanobacterium BLCC-F50]|uniref:Uncharacterized protein n=1 Tax=Floridaenema flaviceps BLCC-F50 TaxID=3153642 RepID=A0ABV4Y109_9CYAN